MQNFLPCKSSPQNRCDVAHGNGVIYEDLANVRPRAMQPPSSIEVQILSTSSQYSNNVPVKSNLIHRFRHMDREVLFFYSLIISLYCPENYLVE